MEILERKVDLKTLNKKLDVIVPIYKGNRYISNLIYMLENNWKFINEVENVDIELVLVNDYPTEKLVIEKHWIKNISCVKITNSKNRGIQFSRIQGLLHSNGEYVLFLDQDDEISPIYVREQLEFLENYDAVICNGKSRGHLIYRNVVELKKAVDINEYLAGVNQIISPGQVLLRRNAVPKDWIQNILSKNGADDYFLWILMFRKNCRIGIQDKILYLHMASEKNASDNLEEMKQSVSEMIEKLIHLGYLNYSEEKKIRKNSFLCSREKKITVEKYFKELRYKEILELWMSLRDKKVSVERFLFKKNIKNIAIYGAGIFGKHLYYELQESEIHIVGFFDRNKSILIPEVKILSPGERFDTVDAIIITPFLEYEQIKKRLEQYYICEILSIETLILNADCELMTEYGARN